MGNKNHKGIGSMILAVLFLVFGVGFGAQRIAIGLRFYGNMPSDGEIHRMEEYLELMEDLDDLLDDPAKYKTLDVDSYLDRQLRGTDLTRTQEREIRELYEDTLASAKGGAVQQELAQNHLLREIVFYRQQIPDPDQLHLIIRNDLLIGGTSILLSLLLFVILMKSAAKKRK